MKAAPINDPIVDEDLAIRVQERLEFNRATYGSQARTVQHDFVLSGFLVCGECGELLEPERAKNNRYLYYKHPRAGATCSRKRWRAEEVESTVLSHLLEVSDQSGLIDEAIRYTSEQRSVTAQGVPEKIKQRELALKRTRDEHSQLLTTLRTKDHSEIPDCNQEPSTRYP